MECFIELMNRMLRLYLDQFIIVFINNILIYSLDYETHAVHLRLVLETLRVHHLFGKLSKYEFWLREVIFWMHVISTQGVAVDPSKIKAVISWPRPNLVSEVRGFLGLVGYYSIFVWGLS